ncbi:MAG: IPT/TIG domain-containing protein [Clostridia bacterium]|nr:IPT/TIG domain-containing protein [Clostridia bacterium]
MIKTNFKKIILWLCLFVFTAVMILPSFGCGTDSAEGIADSDVANSASFSTDTIYQIVTDRFFDGDTSNNPTGELYDTTDNRKYHGGDWAGITKKINDGYLTGLGITAIWISSPVENITSIDPSNNSAAYHGYWAKDYFRINEYFGSVDDFKTLIETAHANGIKVVIDFAPNHTSTAEYGDMVFPEDGALYRDGELVVTYSNDTEGIFNHEEWVNDSSWENGIYHSLYGLADLNQMNSTVDEYLKDAIDLWLDYGVDGIRVDAVKHMPMGWQTNWLSSIYEEHNVFVFGEWYSGSTDSDSQMEYFANESGMSVLDYRFANAIRSALGTQDMTMRQLYSVIEATESDYNEICDQVTFIDNHDISRFMTLSSSSSSSVDMAYVIQMTSSGIPTIYYGSEQYSTGSSDPDNRADMPSFSTSTTAYQIISKLAPIRKNNPAAAYGTTTERWINSDVLVYERTFGNSVLYTAVNRSSTQGYSITGALTALPDGSYGDILENICGGGTLTVSDGAISSYYLGAGQCAVWQYVANSEDGPEIGNIDPLIGIAGNTVTITGCGFGSAAGSVNFGTTAATISSWSDSCIKFVVPDVSAGYYSIVVTTSSGDSVSDYAQYKVLTASQVAVRLICQEAYTEYGQNIYVVGNCVELGNWDTDKAVGAFFNATSSIAEYPNWFFDISLPAGTEIEFKFIKKDSDGNVVWESGSNHVYTTPTNSTGEASYYFYN